MIHDFFSKASIYSKLVIKTRKLPEKCGLNERIISSIKGYTYAFVKTDVLPVAHPVYSQIVLSPSQFLLDGVPTHILAYIPSANDLGS